MRAGKSEYMCIIAYKSIEYVNKKYDITKSMAENDPV